MRDYVPEASRQIILLCTDSELTPDLDKLISPFVARRYEIGVSQGDRQTSVTRARAGGRICTLASFACPVRRRAACKSFVGGRRSHPTFFAARPWPCLLRWARSGRVAEIEEGQEFNAYTLFGGDQPIYTTLLRWVETEDGEVVDDQELIRRLRAHIDRGLSAMSARVKSPGDAARLLAGDSAPSR